MPGAVVGPVPGVVVGAGTAVFDVGVGAGEPVLRRYLTPVAGQFEFDPT